MIKSLRFRILIIVASIVLVISATFMLLSRKEVEEALTRAEQESARNALNLVKLNIENEYNGLLFHKKVTTENFEKQLKYLGDIVITYIDELREKSQKGKLSKKTAQALALEGIRKFRYGEENYFFVIDKNGRTLSHPDPLEMHRYLLTLRDINGKNLGESFLDIALNKGEGYTSYWWKKLKDNTPQQKLVYIKFYPEWNWIIGTGVYIDEIENEIQKRQNIILEGLKNTLLKTKLAKTGYLFVLDGKKQMIIHPNLAGDVAYLTNPSTGKSIADEIFETARHPETPLEYPWDKPSDKGEYKYWKQSYVSYFEPLDWYICSSVYIDEMKEPGMALSQKIFYLSLAFFAVAIILSLLLARTLTIPITNLIKVMNQIKTKGISNLRAPISGTTETRELGFIFNNMLESIDNAISARNKYERELRENAKLVAVGKTASMLAHDVRKPFASIKSVLNSLEYYQNNPSSLSRAKEEIEKSIKDVDAMILDIMDLSREARLDLKPLPMCKIVEASLPQLTYPYQHLDIRFEYSLNNRYRPMVDERRMARVFGNILTNALEAISVLGGRNAGMVKFLSRDISIDQKNLIEIIIANDGPPLVEEDIPNLFESFFTKGKKDGTGLGLASASKIISLHNGTLRARNIKDKVEFVIQVAASEQIEEFTDSGVLPKDLKSISTERLYKNASKPDLIMEDSSKTVIFIVDDDQISRTYLELATADAMKEITPKIFSFESPEAALSEFPRLRPNIVISDYHFGVKSSLKGDSFLKEIKKRFPSVSLFLSSNIASIQLEEVKKDLGISGCFAPTIDIDELSSILLTAISKDRQ